METMIDTEATATLTRADRCDRCGAAAMVRITTDGSGTWLFCGNHGRKFVGAIPNIAYIHDETKTLTFGKETK